MTKTISLVCFLLTFSTLSAQNVQEIYHSENRSTSRTRAFQQQADSTKDSSTVLLLEDWVRAVPNDRGAYLSLAKLYRRLGRTTDALYADSLANRFKVWTSPQHLTRFIPQTRLGSYSVLMPSKVEAAKTYPCVVVLHGNGNTPRLMQDWFSSLGIDSIIAIFPEAPYPKMQEALAANREMYSASGNGLGHPDSVLTDVISMSAAWYHDVLQHAIATLPISKELPLLIGFSQGGFYSLVVATTYSASVKSVISISASLYAEGQIRERLKRLREYNIDVLLAHGTKDAVVPLQTAELIDGMLTEAKINHVFVPFNGGHWPTAEINARIHQWIIERLR